jgi:hypothetical protein
MHLGRIICIASLFLGVSGPAFAALVLPPPGLSPGQSYRLAFVTSDGIAATSANIADYNSFVQTAADNVPALNALGASWKAIVSTPSVNARTNTSSLPSYAGGTTGVPIFLLDGVKIADSYDDLWDSSIDAPLNVTELGGVKPNFTQVWSGSFSDGTVVGGLGTGGNTWFGYTHQTTFGGWLTVTIDPSPSVARPIYAMSSLLTAAVPEASSFAALALTSALAGGVSLLRLRKRA